MSLWSTGEGNGKPLQHSCLENPMNRFFLLTDNQITKTQASEELQGSSKYE